LVPQGDLTPDSLAKMLATIFAAPAELATKAAAAHALATPDAAARLADAVEKIAHPLFQSEPA
ncbi:MAG TPA: hypothetical protein VGU69_01300, partial [Rhizomicrobium sp.]|nr:hypothetical protein [Rhizomicrobium sp.]